MACAESTLCDREEHRGNHRARARTRHPGAAVRDGDTAAAWLGLHGRVSSHFSRLASRYDVPLVPFLLAGVALNPEMNGEDEIHPNAAGAQRIADTVWVFLQPMVEGRSTGLLTTGRRALGLGARS